jgi:SAM-dependent methyltransferase
MNIDNQNEYWDRVSNKKEFTHPLDLEIVKKHIEQDHKIVDYGCGYGRIVHQLINQGYNNIIGFDTSSELIKRGNPNNNLPIYHIDSFDKLPLKKEEVDSIILFAVLTCIPSNEGQKELIKLLYSKLRKGGILYLSDYYLQKNSKEMERYEYLNGDKKNYGVFTLDEGVTFRHHTREWIKELLENFEFIEEKDIEVLTMNKHKAKGFQIVMKKTE